MPDLHSLDISNRSITPTIHNSSEEIRADGGSTARHSGSVTAAPTVMNAMELRDPPETDPYIQPRASLTAFLLIVLKPQTGKYVRTYLLIRPAT